MVTGNLFARVYVADSRALDADASLKDIETIQKRNSQCFFVLEITLLVIHVGILKRKKIASFVGRKN